MKPNSHNFVCLSEIKSIPASTFLERVLILRNFIREISSHSEIKSKIQFLETWSNKAWQPQKVKFIKKKRERERENELYFDQSFNH